MTGYNRGMATLEAILAAVREGDPVALAAWADSLEEEAGRTLKVVSDCPQRGCGNGSRESSVTQLLATKEVTEFIMRLPWRKRETPKALASCASSPGCPRRLGSRYKTGEVLPLQS